MRRNLNRLNRSNNRNNSNLRNEANESQQARLLVNNATQTSKENHNFINYNQTSIQSTSQAFINDHTSGNQYDSPSADANLQFYDAKEHFIIDLTHESDEDDT